MIGTAIVHGRIETAVTAAWDNQEWCNERRETCDTDANCVATDTRRRRKQLRKIDGLKRRQQEIHQAEEYEADHRRTDLCGHLAERERARPR